MSLFNQLNNQQTATTGNIYIGGHQSPYNGTVTTAGGYGGTTTTISTNTLFGSMQSGSYDLGFSTDMTEFFELVLVALGHDITYDKFKAMNSKERKAIMREIKINRVING
jgi:hypothetical protein